MIKAYAMPEKGKPFEAFEYDPGELGDGEVEVEVDYCGICHSDLSMADDDWGMTQYPFVGGHEVAGRVAAVGPNVPADRLKAGDRVGVGWFAQSCMHCRQCLHGRHNLCANDPQQTIVGRHGGFADKVRCHWGWAVPLPEGLDAKQAGPLLCGGVTVFNPLVQHGLSPMSRAAVIGIGGLGHLGLMFLHAWGCEVTAFSTSPDKEDEARKLGAHRFVNVKEKGALENEAGRFDLIINTTNAALDWDAYVNALAPRGVLHTVGVVDGTFGVDSVFPMILAQRTLSASPLSSPATTADMLDFCVRHDIAPVTETFAMGDINDAFEKLRDGSARYRLVLER